MEEIGEHVEKQEKPKKWTWKRKIPLVCSYCQKVFHHKSQYIYHLRIHTNERPYTCSMCGKSFKRNNTLKQHRERHLDTDSSDNAGPNGNGSTKKYQCDICAKVFRKFAGIKRHLNVHSNEKSIGCSLCGKKFKCKSGLNYHIKSFHENGYTFYCEICKKTLKGQSTEKKRHLEVHLRAASPQKSRRGRKSTIQAKSKALEKVKTKMITRTNKSSKENNELNSKQIGLKKKACMKVAKTMLHSPELTCEATSTEIDAMQSANTEASNASIAHETAESNVDSFETLDFVNDNVACNIKSEIIEVNENISLCSKNTEEDIKHIPVNIKTENVIEGEKQVVDVYTEMVKEENKDDLYEEMTEKDKVDSLYCNLPTKQLKDYAESTDVGADDNYENTCGSIDDEDDDDDDDESNDFNSDTEDEAYAEMDISDL